MRWQAASGASLARHSRGRRTPFRAAAARQRSEEHTSELQSRSDLVCRLLLEKKKKIRVIQSYTEAYRNGLYTRRVIRCSVFQEERMIGRSTNQLWVIACHIFVKSTQPPVRLR